MAVQFNRTNAHVLQKGERASDCNHSNHVHFKSVEIPVSTGKGESKREGVASVEVPATLKDAIAAEGEHKVFRRYAQSLSIELQGDHRKELQEKPAGEKRRAGYMEEWGI
jgi:hypothetical protein